MPESDFVKPMLVSEIPGYRDRIKSAGHLFVQPKLDGWCCMANTRTRKIYTRSGNEITTLPHINAALPTGGPTWLHGELWKQGANCDDVQRMVKRGDASIELHVFDLVDPEPFKARTSYIHICMTPFTPIGRSCNPIKTVPTFEIMPEQIDDFYIRFRAEGYEGIIIRLDGHGYQHHRSINVFKMKPGTEVI